MAIRTNYYRELEYRHLKLNQLFGVLMELEMHVNKAVNPATSAYYSRVLTNHGVFFVAAFDAMKQVFYSELHGFIGAYWDVNSDSIKGRKNDEGSLYEFLFDGKRQNEKRIVQVMFVDLLQREVEPLGRLHDLRGKLAHFARLHNRNSSLVNGYDETKRILNSLAEILHKIGYQRGNKPHYYKDSDSASANVQQLVDELSIGKNGDNMRQKYLISREEWLVK